MPTFDTIAALVQFANSLRGDPDFRERLRLDPNAALETIFGNETKKRFEFVPAEIAAGFFAEVRSGRAVWDAFNVIDEWLASNRKDWPSIADMFKDDPLADAPDEDMVTRERLEPIIYRMLYNPADFLIFVEDFGVADMPGIDDAEQAAFALANVVMIVNATVAANANSVANAYAIKNVAIYTDAVAVTDALVLSQAVIFGSLVEQSVVDVMSPDRYLVTVSGGAMESSLAQVLEAAGVSTTRLMVAIQRSVQRQAAGRVEKVSEARIEAVQFSIEGWTVELDVAFSEREALVQAVRMTR